MLVLEKMWSQFGYLIFVFHIILHVKCHSVQDKTIENLQNALNSHSKAIETVQDNLKSSSSAWNWVIDNQRLVNILELSWLN